MESSKDESLIDLLNRVLAVIFCGTPHRGASAAAWGSLVSRLAAVALTDSNTRLLSDMEIDSQILDMIQDNFLRTLQYHPSLRVHTFLEGKAMTGVKGIDGKVRNFQALRAKFKFSDCDRSSMTSPPRLVGRKEQGMRP